jgi:hypothetical protein
MKAVMVRIYEGMQEGNLLEEELKEDRGECMQVIVEQE